MSDKWQDQLPFYVAGLLEAQERAALEEHLVECPKCRNLLPLWQDIAVVVRDDVARRVADDKLKSFVLPVVHGNGRKLEPSVVQFSNGEEMPVNYRMLNATVQSRIQTSRSLRRQVLNRVASVLILLVLLGGVIAVWAVLSGPALSPANGGFVNQAGGLTPTPPSAAPVIPVASLPGRTFLELDALHYEAQTWNNAGPATLAMALSYLGWSGDQRAAAAWLRPNVEDKSVAPPQLVHYVRDRTVFEALSRLGGTPSLLKQLLAAGFPVIAQVGFEPNSEGWLGHYLLLVGYDDDRRAFWTFDSYLRSNDEQGRPVSYAEFDERWSQFNRLFVVVFDPSLAGEVSAVLGDYIDPRYGYRAALNAAREQIAVDQGNKWAWFSLGTAYVSLGDYQNAANAYDRAFQLGMPFRTLWYQFGPYEAYYRARRLDDVLALGQNTAASTRYVEETAYWMGMAYVAQGQLEEGFQQFREVLQINPNFDPLQASTQ